MHASGLKGGDVGRAVAAIVLKPMRHAGEALWTAGGQFVSLATERQPLAGACTAFVRIHGVGFLYTSGVSSPLLNGQRPFLDLRCSASPGSSLQCLS